MAVVRIPRGSLGESLTHGQAPRKCSGSLKTFCLGLAEILGGRKPHVPEEPALLLSTHRCNLILGVTM